MSEGATASDDVKLLRILTELLNFANKVKLGKWKEIDRFIMTANYRLRFHYMTASLRTQGVLESLRDTLHKRSHAIEMFDGYVDELIRLIDSLLPDVTGVLATEARTVVHAAKMRVDRRHMVLLRKLTELLKSANSVITDRIPLQSGVNRLAGQITTWFQGIVAASRSERNRFTEPYVKRLIDAISNGEFPNERFEACVKELISQIDSLLQVIVPNEAREAIEDKVSWEAIVAARVQIVTMLRTQATEARARLAANPLNHLYQTAVNEADVRLNTAIIRLRAEMQTQAARLGEATLRAEMQTQAARLGEARDAAEGNSDQGESKHEIPDPYESKFETSAGESEHPNTMPYDTHTHTIRKWASENIEDESMNIPSMNIPSMMPLDMSLLTDATHTIRNMAEREINTALAAVPDPKMKVRLFNFFWSYNEVAKNWEQLHLAAQDALRALKDGQKDAQSAMVAAGKFQYEVWMRRRWLTEASLQLTAFRDAVNAIVNLKAKKMLLDDVHKFELQLEDMERNEGSIVSKAKRLSRQVKEYIIQREGGEGGAGGAGGAGGGESKGLRLRF